MTPGQVERVFVIADLSGYTALTEAHGDVHAAEAVIRYTEIAQVVLDPGTTLVERVGDEILLAAEDATSAVRTAVRLRDAVEKEPLFPTIRAGVHAGAAVHQGESYFGSALNLTARVAAYARAGQILCTKQVTTLATDLEDTAYEPLGLVQFKNIVDPVPIFEVVSASRSTENKSVDPVCRMQVNTETAPARLPFGGQTYHFCSFECARAFAERPDQYIHSRVPRL